MIRLNYTRPWLYAKQEAAFFNPSRISTIEASSKSGKTVGGIAWLTELALRGKPDWNYWWVAPVTAQAKIAYRRMKSGLAKNAYHAQETEKKITLIGGQHIWFKGSDDPDCYDGITEILTDSGWKLFNDLRGDERVLTRRLDGTAEWQRPTRYIQCPYEGEMVKIENGRIDLLVTPNHRMLIERTRHRTKRIVEGFVRADNLKVHGHRIPATSKWEGVDDPFISDDMCALMGLYLADGTALGNSSPDPKRLTDRCGYRIQFSKLEGIKGGTKGNVREKFRMVLQRLGYKISEPRAGLLIWDKSLWSKLIVLGNKYTKYVPQNFKDLPREKLKVLLHWLVMGDGTLQDNNMTYFSVSPRLADDVQEIAIKCGWSATIRKRPGITFLRIGNKKTTGAVGYIVNIQRETSAHCLTKTRHPYVSRQIYCGMVYCVSVPNTVILVRRNGKPIWSGNSLYGEDVYGAVIDEGSRVKEDAYHAVRSTLTATRGPFRVIGNVKGRKNWFYRLSRRAEASPPGSGIEFHKITAYEAAAAGILDDEEVQLAKRDLPEDVFKQLYMAEATDDEGNPFGYAAIRACLIEGMSMKPPVCWGWDLGKSVDYTVGIALDEDGVVCRFERFQLPWTATINIIRDRTGRTPALVDSTGLGDPILEANLQTNYGSNFEGFKFTGPSKQQLMEGLAVAIHQKTVRFPEGPISIELEQFEYEFSRAGVRYSSPPGLHDDTVCALALCVRKKSDPSSIQTWLKAFGE